MIRLENVSKSYSEGIPALNNVSIQIQEGEFVFVVGDSGSGKSTLIKLLLKELEPTEGKIYINKKEVGNIRHKQIPVFRRQIGVVFQDFRLLKDRNVYDNVGFAMRVIGEPGRTIRRKVPQMLSMVGLAAKYRSYPKQLSGGEQQRVAIARALVNEPKILLADEPTGNLDNNNAWEIMSLLEEINARGTTVVVVTHNLEIVHKMQKRVIEIDKGIVVSDGIKESGEWEPSAEQAYNPVKPSSIQEAIHSSIQTTMQAVSNQTVQESARTMMHTVQNIPSQAAGPLDQQSDTDLEQRNRQTEKRTDRQTGRQKGQQTKNKGSRKLQNEKKTYSGYIKNAEPADDTAGTDSMSDMVRMNSSNNSTKENGGDKKRRPGGLHG